MKKTNEIIKQFKEKCSNLLNIVFSIQMSKQEFETMVKEVEELQNDAANMVTRLMEMKDALEEVYETVDSFYLETEAEGVRRLRQDIKSIAGEIIVIHKVSSRALGKNR